MLDREIPLRDVIPARMGIEKCLAKSGGRVYESKRSARKRLVRQVGGAPQLKERRRKKFIELDEISERQNVEHPKPCINRSLAAAERVPGNSHSRLKIAQRGIGKQGIAHVRGCVCDVPKRG